jgi:ABC-2 type transport system permease protein
MNKTWLVAGATYRRRVRSGSYLALTLVVPLLMVVVGALSLWLTGFGAKLPPIGYVDQTGQLGAVSSVPVMETQDSLLVTAYPDVGAAEAALQGGSIAGYLVIPPHYLSGAEEAAFYGDEAPSAALQVALAALVRRALLPDAPAWVEARLDTPSTIVHVVPARELEVVEGPALVIRFALPALLAILLAFLIFTGASQMGSAVVQEKESRAMEMVITSLSPRQLLVGKVLGTALLALTQLGAWLIGGAIAVLLAGVTPADLAALRIPWPVLAWALLLGVPGYFLFAVLAAGLGIVAGDSRQAQQLSGTLGLFVMAPLWFAGQLVAAPDSTVAVALTLFPLTAPVFALFRMALTEVPTWQLITAFILIGFSLVAAVWLVARLFRTAMLLYGQALRPRQVWLALRAA